MIGRGRAMALATLAALSAWAIFPSDEKAPPRPPEQRPALALLTSLPLVFAEEFDLGRGGSPALDRLEQRYDVEPVAVADAAGLAGKAMLLMAHPRAQPAEVLVELDHWVRSGGRLLLLADPRLDWPSERPLGDRLRPPPAFADTGLLRRWGMSLSGPWPAGPATASNGTREVKTSAPGRIESSSCTVIGDGFVARCDIGEGWVTVIADADFLDVGSNGREENLELLIDELANLESR